MSKRQTVHPLRIAHECFAFVPFQILRKAIADKHLGLDTLTYNKRKMEIFYSQASNYDIQ